MLSPRRTFAGRRNPIPLLVAIRRDHAGDPHRVMAQCAKIADAVIVTDLHYPEMDPCGPIMRCHPTPENTDWGLWWHLTPSFMSVLGFEPRPAILHEQRNARNDGNAKFFTVVAHARTDPRTASALP